MDFENEDNQYKHNELNLDVENEYTIEDEIQLVEEQLDDMCNIFSNMWDTIIEPYLQNPNSQILDKLKLSGKSHFINFMIENNKTYNRLNEYLNKLLKY